MKKLLFIAALVLLSTTAVPVYAGPTPRATVQSFLIAARSGNVAGVKKCINGGHKLANPDAQGIALMRIMFQGAKIVRVEKVNYAHSVVYVKITNPANGVTETVPMSVKKIQGDWKICDN